MLSGVSVMRKNARAALVLVLAAGLSLLGAGCATDLATDNTAQVSLVVGEVSATAGGNGTGGGFLLSDVYPVFNDDAILSVAALPKNRNVTDLDPLQNIVLERYEVRYSRSDGRNVEGVDVPYRVSGVMNATVPADGKYTDAAIMVVRHQAKMEPPLIQLKGLGGQVVISTVAEITIHGRTLGGEAVSATGRLMVTFADYAD